jgi:hypothetical protein
MRWPSRDAVDTAVRDWSQRLVQAESAVVAVGYFGSYARGDATVGSDVDLIVITDRPIPIHQRLGGPWVTEHFPVPAEILVYDHQQWQALIESDSRFYRTLRDEAVWVVNAMSS